MKVFVTGLGAHCALGDNIEALWAAMKKGESGISTINRFDVTPFETDLGAMVSSGDGYDTEIQRLMAYGCSAAKEALQQAEIFDLSQVALVLGTSNGLLGKEIYSVGTDMARELKLGGMVLTVSNACTSSAHAMGFAADLIRRGSIEYALAGGVDTLTLDVFAGFHSLGLLSKSPCAPFSINMGTTLGEGAGFMFLESEDSAYDRGVNLLATLMGYGLSADAFHDTKPDPYGLGMARAINAALQDAGLSPNDIDYLNAHGTATAANDAAEWRAIQRVFGNHADRLPVSSSKSFLGHVQGAAGVLEAVTTLTAMRNKVIPPTLNLTENRPNSPTDPVAAKRPRSHVVRYAVCTNAAFGGVNSAVVFGHVNGDSLPIKKVPRRVGLSSTGMVLDGNQISRFVPRAELRGIDTSARLLAGAIAYSLTNAGIRLRSPVCEDIGLFVGQSHVSPESVEAFEKSIEEHGIMHLSAAAFTRMVVNYATGVCCRLFGMKGPVATVATQPDSGLSALVLGADHLSWNNNRNYLITAAVDEPGQEDDYKGGAASILLEAGEVSTPISLTGWALAKDCEAAVSRALIMADQHPNDVVPIEVSGPPASAGLMAVIEAIEALKNNKQGPFLVSSNGAGSSGAAIILEKEDTYAS